MRMVIAATSSAARGPVAAAPSLCECSSLSPPPPAAQLSSLAQERDCTTVRPRPSASEYVATQTMVAFGQKNSGQ